ncbi:16S rRNA (cytosine(967)-C(5))-methyltransferase RsmB [Methylohalobius crimeensis]|uniref:16S rRNA (cytosine(967)-C(5))-methyltransferase RsmB n=1 Tax=Methylohalobius crimeensis TaxID=244365 RepID=UPI0003B4E6E5|nr:16S rRNA (cytosine(967)-C(5))-methyltransferase RsmB [Methylohalobius crimeensis]
MSNVRSSAADVVRQVLAGQSLADALPSALAKLPPNQHALLKALCFGTLRWFHRLEFILQQLAHRPIKNAQIHALALIGLHQLAFMAVKPHAAVAETVAAAGSKTWARPLLNALLRNFQRRREALETAADADFEAAVSHPAWLRRRLERDWPRQAAAILTANNRQPPMTLRVDLARIDRERYRNRLLDEGMTALPVAGVDSALILARAVPVEALPGFAEGLVSVQDAAAQLAASLMDLRPGQRVLDLCAAPGGKTLHLLESCSGFSEIVAVDISETRLARIRENLARAARKEAGVALICGDARSPADWWDGKPFDRILADVPCSATGVIRRHPDIKVLRREEDIAALVEGQQEILRQVWPLLAEGGRLVYATCSVLPEENEAQIRDFLQAHPEARCAPIEGAWGEDRRGGRQILTGGEPDMDGFFYACLEKCASS